MISLADYIREAKEIDWLIKIPSYNVQPSDLEEINRDLLKAFSTTEPGPEDDDFLTYVVTADEKKVKKFVKMYDGEYEQYKYE